MPTTAGIRRAGPVSTRSLVVLVVAGLVAFLLNPLSGPARAELGVIRVSLASVAYGPLTEPSGRALSVNVDPNLGSDAWRFTLQRRSGSGWVDVGSYRTRGRAEKAWFDVRSGSYRVVVPAQGGYAGQTSGEFEHRRPSATVTVSSDGADVVANAGPNLSGSSSYVMRLQQRRQDDSWVTVRSQRSVGTAERARFSGVPTGTYRVRVIGTRGFDSVTSDPIDHRAPTVRVSLASVAYGPLTEPSGRALSVNVDPNLGSDAWRFTLQRRSGSGWVDVGSYRTRGRAEKAWFDVRSGSYRVVVPAQGGYAGQTSGEFEHRRPSATVTVSSDGADVVANAGPNLSGSSSYVMRLQQRRQDDSWVTVRSQRSVGTAERARFSGVPTGTYRVRVIGTRGFDSVTSDPIDHVDPRLQVSISSRPVMSGNYQEAVAAGIRVSVSIQAPGLSGPWDFRLSRRGADGFWLPAGSYRTGSDGRKTVVLPYGRYRLIVPEQQGKQQQRIIHTRQAPRVSDADLWYRCSVDGVAGNPIDYYVNLDGAVDRIDEIVAAVAEVDRHTPVAFRYRGTTSQTRINDALVIHVDPDTDFEGAIGLGGFDYARYYADGRSWMRFRYVVLVEPGFHADADRAEYRSLIMHEVGHTLGAMHTGRRTDLMYPYLYATDVTVWDAEQFERDVTAPCPL